MAVFAKLGALAPTLLLSTELLPDPLPALDRWWYFAPEAGQHIGFFTRRSLEVVAERLNRRLSTNDRNLHVIGHERVSAALLSALRKPRGARLLAPLGRRRSLAHDDAERLQACLRARQRDVPTD